MMKEHTFIICAYQESKYLEDCIKSLLAQTLKSEIIIATSTPNQFLFDVAAKYQLPLASHKNYGIANDWNFGLSLGKTDFVTLAHQDDIYLPDFTEINISKLKARNDSLISFSDYREIKNEKIISRTKNMIIKKIMLLPLKLFRRSKFVRKRILSLGSPICCPAVTYNKKKLAKFLFDPNLGVSLDWNAWYQIALMKGSFFYSDKVLILHRIHEESETTNAIHENRRCQEDLEMFEKFWPKPIAKRLNEFYKMSQDTNELM